MWINIELDKEQWLNYFMLEITSTRGANSTIKKVWREELFSQILLEFNVALPVLIARQWQA